MPTPPTPNPSPARRAAMRMGLTHCPLQGEGRTALVICGALGKEVKDIVDRRGWDVDIYGVSALLHLYPSLIVDELRERLHALRPRYERLVVVYGDCGMNGRLEPLLERVAAADRGVAEIERQLERPGDHVGRTGSGVDVRYLPRSRRKVLVALVPAHRREFGNGWRRDVDRILRQVGIGDVPLHAAHDQRSGKRPAASVLDHVAETVDRGGFADDAIVERLARGPELVDDLDGAVGRRAFFVRGNQ